MIERLLILAILFLLACSGPEEPIWSCTTEVMEGRTVLRTTRHTETEEWIFRKGIPDMLDFGGNSVWLQAGERYLTIVTCRRAR